MLVEVLSHRAKKWYNSEKAEEKALRSTYAYCRESQISKGGSWVRRQSTILRSNITLSCRVRRNNWISSQRDFWSLKESRKMEKNGSWSFKCSKNERESLVLNKILLKIKKKKQKHFLWHITESPHIFFSKLGRSSARSKSPSLTRVVHKEPLCRRPAFGAWMSHSPSRGSFLDILNFLKTSIQ